MGIRFNNAGKWACDRLTEDADVGKKKVFSDDDAPKTVWCGFWSRSIIGPFFFENEQGDAVTVNGDRYRAMLNELLFTKIEEKDIGNIWFQQDGFTCHTADATLDLIIISSRADVVWSPRSCDLTPLDYYLWGTVKDKCYADKPETIDAIMCLDRSCRLLHGQPRQPFE